MFNILRSDGGTDGGAAGPTGKAHPIFGRRKGKSISSGGDGGAGQSWRGLPCTISFIESYPRFRPPICVAIIGLVFVGCGIAIFCLNLETELLPTYSGAAITALGGISIFASGIWFMIARKNIAKSLAAMIEHEEATRRQQLMTEDRKDIPVDPIMLRSMVNIYFRSCEDTQPFGSDRTPAGTKVVRVPPKDSYISVESTCFQLMKATNNAKKTSSYPSTPIDHLPPTARLGTGRKLPRRPSQDIPRSYSGADRVKNFRHQLTFPPSSGYAMETVNEEQQLMQFEE